MPLGDVLFCIGSNVFCFACCIFFRLVADCRGLCIESGAPRVSLSVVAMSCLWSMAKKRRRDMAKRCSAILESGEKCGSFAFAARCRACGGGFCAKHGGNPCQVHGCLRAARKGGFCFSHRGKADVHEEEPGVDEAAVAEKECRKCADTKATFGVGAVMDDSKEGIINIERGEEDDMIYRCAIYRCAIHEKRLNDLTMPQLRHLLDERGSTATGKWKEVLVDRCCDLGVTAAEIADAKKFKGKVRGLAVAAQDSKRARIAGPDADALAEAGALHRAGWKFSV